MYNVLFVLMENISMLYAAGKWRRRDEQSAGGRKRNNVVLFSAGLIKMTSSVENKMMCSGYEKNMK